MSFCLYVFKVWHLIFEGHSFKIISPCDQTLDFSRKQRMQFIETYICYDSAFLTTITYRLVNIAETVQLCCHTTALISILGMERHRERVSE